jgi:hypothetical protein
MHHTIPCLVPGHDEWQSPFAYLSIRVSEASTATCVLAPGQHIFLTQGRWTLTVTAEGRNLQGRTPLPSVHVIQVPHPPSGPA